MATRVWQFAAAGVGACLILGAGFQGCSGGGSSGGGAFASPAPTPTPTPAATLAIATTSLTDGAVGQGYSALLQSTGGTGPITWSVTSGSLPSGVNLASSGALSGMPTAAGGSSFTVMAQDASSPRQQAQRGLTLTVQSASGGGGGGGSGSTITLTVVDQFGNPISGATAWINPGSTQTTNAFGQATFAGVTLPYTVNASATSQGTASTALYQTVTLVESRRTTPTLGFVLNPLAAELVKLSGSLSAGAMTVVDANYSVSPSDQAYDGFANPAFAIYAAPGKNVYVSALDMTSTPLDDGAISGPFNAAAGTAQIVSLNLVGAANLVSISGTLTLPASLSAANNVGPGVYAHYDPVDSLVNNVWIGNGAMSGSGTSRTYTAKHVAPPGTPVKGIVATIFNAARDGWAGGQLSFTNTGPALVFDDGPISVTAPASGAGFLANPAIAWVAPAAGADVTYVTVQQQGAGYMRRWRVILPTSRSAYTLGAIPAALTDHPLQNGILTSVSVTTYDLSGFSGYDTFDFNTRPVEYGAGGGSVKFTLSP